MKAIINTKLILEDSYIWDGVVTFENGYIVQCGRCADVQIPENAQIIDARGLYTAPGFVDIHNHGGEGTLFYQDPEKCADFFLAHGETTVLAAFYCDLTCEQMLAGLQRIRSAQETPAGKTIAGVYMEGPYMNGEGSGQKYIRWNGEIRKEEYQPLIEAMRGTARIWAIDPARPGIEMFMQDVRREDPNAIFALGHSHATAAQCRRVRKYGVKVQTHHGDSGKAPGHAQGTVGAGCDEYTLYDPEMYAELICDETGIHVDPDMLKMVVRTKGVEKVILITDSMPGNGSYKNNEADGIAWGPDLNYDYEGHLAGSHLTLDGACRNLMRHTGYGLCHAVRMASLNPAKLLGMEDEIGSIAPGKKANLLLIDDLVNVHQVILEGKTIMPHARA